ncbi:hypothetical protein [Haloarcula pellucida]|uniref:Lipoprotein n=1 Tax=Haloarcula pellucida TaxID=1427151 RepID=A0A830GRX2_9EURY|nr:hypothetical protein [Halomicroarcula pellucida]MBX0350320.1 hypothetical protein [Halomicroarcula pellucida]GGO01499.1 hypothetical protein GCM10009030_35230 [Halomicroarcula pellucida]
MPWSRRRILTALSSGVAAGLAGCETGDSPAPPPTDEDDDRLVDEYDSVHVRNTDGAVLYTTRDTIPTDTEDAQRLLRGSDHLVTRASFEEATFGSVPEARELRSFVAETDFETHSIYLFTTAVDACHEIHITSMERDSDGDPHGNFCQARRPADVTCSTDDTDSVAIAVRLPFSAERSSGLGTGMASYCRRPDDPVAFRAEVTPRNGSDGS